MHVSKDARKVKRSRTSPQRGCAKVGEQGSLEAQRSFKGWRISGRGRLGGGWSRRVSADRPALRGGLTSRRDESHLIRGRPLRDLPRPSLASANASSNRQLRRMERAEASRGHLQAHQRSRCQSLQSTHHVVIGHYRKSRGHDQSRKMDLLQPDRRRKPGRVAKHSQERLALSHGEGQRLR